MSDENHPKYNIHIEHASGVVIGDNAQVTQNFNASSSTTPPSPFVNLPTKTYTQLWGRESALAQVLSTLTSTTGPHIVAISGLGGIGKTALAQAVAEQVIRDRLFTGAVWESAKQEELTTSGVIQLRPSTITFETLLDAISRQLGQADISKLSFDDKRAAVQQLLRRDRYLIIVDNLETVEDYEALVPTLRDLLGESRALLTSRRHLEQIAGVYGLLLSGLDRQHALQFLRAESQERGLSLLATAPDKPLNEIHSTTGGAPLALKLVVGQVAGGLPLDSILANLRQAKGDIYPFIYRASWEQLSSPAQKILIYIGRTAPAATTISHRELSEVGIASGEVFQRALSHLIAMSLVAPTPGLTSAQTRYGVHPLTRHFVLSELPKLWQQPPM